MVGQCFLEIVQNNVNQTFENLPYQDEVPPHNAIIITDYLNQMGNRGTVAWPVHLPDLTP